MSDAASHTHPIKIGLGMSLAAPPPPVWALDVARQSSPAASAPVPRATGKTDIEQVSSAWKHVRNVIREDAKPADLFDLLSHSVRETQYSFQPQGVSLR